MNLFQFEMSYFQFGMTPKNNYTFAAILLFTFEQEYNTVYVRHDIFL